MSDVQRLRRALEAADAAGNEQDARRLASALRAQLAQQGTSPTQFPGQQPMAEQPGPGDVAEQRAIEQGAIAQQVGAPFDPSAGITSPGQRFSLARQSSPESQAAILQQQMPGADVQVVDTESGRQRPVFRPEGEEAFRGINPPGADIGDLGTVAGFLFNVENLTAIGASVASRGLSWPWRMATVGAAAGGGRLVDEGIDVARGAGVDPLDDIFGRAAMSTVFGAAGEGLGSIASRLINIPRGGGFLEPTEGVSAAARAAADEGLPQLTLGQTHPAFQRRENQAAMTSQVVLDYVARQGRAVERGLRSMRGDAPAVTDAQLDEAVQILGSAINEGIRNPQVALREGGAALQRGRDSFTQLSQEWVGRKYDRALQQLSNRQGEVSWDLAPVLQAADDVASGTLGRGRMQPVESQMLGPDGRPLTTMQQPDVRVDASPQGELANVIRVVRELDTTQSGRQGYDALIELRRRLFNLKEQDWQTATPQQRDEIAGAGRLYRSLSQSIDNPSLFGVPDQEFSRLWGAATRANRWRESVLGADDVRRLAQSENPADLARQFAAPGETTTLRLFKRIMPEDDWRTFQQSFETRLLSEPDKIPSVLDSFRRDPDALNLLMPNRTRVAEFRQLGEATRRVNAFERELRKQNDFGRRAMAMVDEGRSRELEIIMRRAGPNSEFGQTARAGIVQSVLDKASKFDDTLGQMVIDPAHGVRVIGDFIERPVARRVLTRQDVKTLENYRAYLSQLPSRGDVGAGIAGAEKASAAFDFLNVLTAGGARFVKGQAELGQNALVARLFTGGRAQRYLTGSGRELRPLTSVRSAATLMSLVAADLERHGAAASLVEQEPPGE